MVRRAIWTAAVTAIISKMSSTVMVNQPPGIGSHSQNPVQLLVDPVVVPWSESQGKIGLSSSRCAAVCGFAVDVDGGHCQPAVLTNST